MWLYQGAESGVWTKKRLDIKNYSLHSHSFQNPAANYLWFCQTHFRMSGKLPVVLWNKLGERKMGFKKKKQQETPLKLLIPLEANWCMHIPLDKGGKAAGAAGCTGWATGWAGAGVVVALPKLLKSAKPPGKHTRTLPVSTPSHVLFCHQPSFTQQLKSRTSLTNAAAGRHVAKTENVQLRKG